MKAGEWAELMDAVPENPDRSAVADVLVAQRQATFRVAVPVTGGMDSSTLWAMAAEAGLPAIAFYVRLGQEYADAELDAIRHVCGVDPVVLVVPSLSGRWGHIIPRRNLWITHAIAEWVTAQGWWGEVWFGNLAGESPAARGDKSSAFFVGLAEHWANTASVQDIIVAQPLRGLDKTDLVRWWAARGRLDVLRATKSCLDPQRLACGACQTCFRKMVAFAAAGESIDGMFDAQAWGPFVAKYRPAMTAAVAAGDWSRYSPARCRDTLGVIAQLEPSVLRS